MVLNYLRAYDFLATLIWLERIRPEILTGLDTDNMVEAARRRLESEGQEFFARAIRVPNPEGSARRGKRPARELRGVDRPHAGANGWPGG